jgi:hypothetical protein
MPDSPQDELVEVVNSDGDKRWQPASTLGIAEQQGWRPVTGLEKVEASAAASKEAVLTSPKSQFKAGVLGLRSAVTGGLADLLDHAELSKEQLKYREDLRNANPVLNKGTEIVGTVGLGLLSLGTSLPASAARLSMPGLAAPIATRVASKLGGKTAAKLIGAAAEGTAFAVQQTAIELGSSSEDITLDRALDSLKTNVLLNVGGGVGLTIVGNAAGKAYRGTKKVIDATADNLATRATAAASTKADRVAKFTMLADDVKQFSDDIVGSDVYRAVGNDTDFAVFTRTAKSIKKNVYSPESFASNPKRTLGDLYEMRTALKNAADDTDFLAKIKQDNLDAIGELDKAVTKGSAADEIVISGNSKGKLPARYRELTGNKLTAKGKATLTVEEANALRQSIASGENVGFRQAAFNKLPERLAKIEDVIGKIETASEFAAPAAKSFVGEALSAAGSVAGAAAFGPVGAALGGTGREILGRVVDVAKERLLSRFANSAAESVNRSAAAVKAFTSKAATTGEKIASITPVLATRVLSAVRFAAEDEGEDTASAKALSQPGNGQQQEPLVREYKRVASEVLSHVEMGPTGTPQVTRRSRDKIANNASGLAAVDPLAADKAETMAVRRIEFYASKVPKRPDYAASPLVSDLWRPSEQEIRSFARFVGAGEDPGGVEERLAAGTVTPEDVEAYRAIYPERFELFKQTVLEQVAELRTRLPYERQVALSIMTGVPVDPAFHPAVLSMLQSMHLNEPETEGGTQAPKPQPQFGSISKPEPTDSQKRSGE